jgi:hypothetical protein
MNIKKQNAKNAFNELTLELTKGKKRWTPRQRYLFNRVSKYLES